MVVAVQAYANGFGDISASTSFHPTMEDAIDGILREVREVFRSNCPWSDEEIRADLIDCGRFAAGTDVTELDYDYIWTVTEYEPQKKDETR